MSGPLYLGVWRIGTVGKFSPICPTGFKPKCDSLRASTWTESFNLRSSTLLYNRLLSHLIES